MPVGVQIVSREDSPEYLHIVQALGAPLVRLEMNRTPVRVAIERLKHDGLVELIKRKACWTRKAHELWFS